ncbi:hypothetical protein B0T21DRAFT_378898 [Apiosordaria backusii]|uniref:Heterokaryon incompatibility domain-containing protein n=1 Tax=Apiosordaria backusii TaxID=314023 RepID=A0AA39ZPP5_9PEZI|nr:hypothetical protein B0T21DRAFT_378898 [Apiosordaria backusii]
MSKTQQPGEGLRPHLFRTFSLLRSFTTGCFRTSQKLGGVSFLLPAVQPSEAANRNHFVSSLVNAMRLLVTNSATGDKRPLRLATHEYIGSPSTVPPYAILSHTWDPASEVTFQELALFSHHVAFSPLSRQAISAILVIFISGLYLLSSYSLGQVPVSMPSAYALIFLSVSYLAINIHSPSGGQVLLKQKQPGYSKIEKTFLLARKHGLQHAWVDTCCIDKTSSAELAEAINSMYAWYARATVCFVYLSDLDPVAAQNNLEEALPKCRWFTRGWTLQELIAPKHVIFFDKAWNERGTKAGLSGLLSNITGIPEELLKGETSLEHYSVARRMSWASRRETTREEDTAYCLLGIFNVNMSLIYGEGMNAFHRLQKVILEETADRSLFVWTDDDDENDGSHKLWSPVLAESPRPFKCAGNVNVTLADSINRNLSIGPRGIQVQVCLIYVPEKIEEDDGNKCILDVFSKIDNVSIGVFIRKVSGGRYVRYKPWKLAKIGEGFSYQPWQDTNTTFVDTVLLATKLPAEFPFFDGFDPILGNRHSALKLRLGPSTPEFSADQCRALPRSHWDMHDNIFFCANQVSKAWCAFFLHGQLADTETTCIPVNLFLACIRWNIKQSFVILGSLEDLEPETRVFLEYQLDKLEFESCRKAETIIMSVFDGKLNGSTTILQTSVVDKSQIPISNDQRALLHAGRAFQTNGPATSSAGWHYRVPSDRERVRVEVSVELVEEEDRNICVNPVTVLDLRLKLLR